VEKVRVRREKRENPISKLRFFLVIPIGYANLIADLPNHRKANRSPLNQNKHNNRAANETGKNSKGNWRTA